MQRVLVDVPALGDRLRAAVVLDVHPAQARLHRQVLLEHLGRRVALHEDVGGVEDQHHGRMVHLPVDLGQQVAVAADQVRLDLQAEGQVGAVAGLGDLAQADRRPAAGAPRGSLALGLIEREAADQLGLEGMGQLAGLLHVAGQVLLERHVDVLRAVVDVASFTLPIGEPIDETFSPYSSCRWRIFWISAGVSFITFLTPSPTSMKRML